MLPVLAALSAHRHPTTGGYGGPARGSGAGTRAAVSRLVTVIERHGRREATSPQPLSTGTMTGGTAGEAAAGSRTRDPGTVRMPTGPRASHPARATGATGTAARHTGTDAGRHLTRPDTG